MAHSTPHAASYHLSSYELMPGMILLLEKLTVAQIMKKFPLVSGGRI
jgi:hypothetical protein